MNRWRRGARLLLGLVTLSVPIVVAVALHHHAARPGTSAPMPAVAPNAIAESTSGVVTQIQGTRETFRVAYQRQSTFTGGATRLDGVTVTVDDRGGRNFQVTGRQGQLTDDHSSVTLTGDVRLAVSDGLQAAAEQATYTQGDGLVRAPGAATFRRGRMSGSSVGLTYDKNSDTLSLLKQAVIHIAPDAHGQGGANLQAGSAEYLRRQHMLVFQGGVRLVRDGRTVQAESGTAYLTPDEKRLSQLDLQGGSHIEGAAGGAGSLEGLAAQSMNLQYRTDGGGGLQQATLVGGAEMDIAGQAAGQPRRIGADSLNISLAPDGTTVTALTGRGRVALNFPAEAGAPPRTITADDLGANGTASRGLSAALLTGHVVYREHRPGGDRIAKAARLELTLAPGLGAVHEARFGGGVRFAQGEMEAQSATARYDVVRGVVDLAGGLPPDTEPHVSDPRLIVDAARVVLTPDGPKLTATGQVRSVLRASSGAGHPETASGTAGGAPPRLPAILKTDQPVNVTGEELVYDGTASHATYSGHARLWQGDTAIQGDTIVIDDRTGNLTASGSVRTSMRMDERDSKTKKMKKATVIASAHDLAYDDSLRRATYTTDAHMDGPDGDLTADRIELYLSAGGDQVERLEGYDHITLRQTGRVVTGDRLSYFAKDERYVVTGAPVKIDEECRKTLGKTLTFFKATDKILVDGGGAYRTETKSGGNCSGPRGE